jgi:hypothetical protein
MGHVLFLSDIVSEFKNQMYNPRRNKHLEDLDLEGGIILKLTLMEENVRMWTVH